MERVWTRAARVRRAAACLGAVLGALAASSWAEEPIKPIPLTTQGGDPARIALGAQLFRDTRLSADGRTSCMTCHPLEHGGADRSVTPSFAGGWSRLRNTPTVFNSALNMAYNWDGAFETVEEVIRSVMRNPLRMNTSPETAAQWLERDDRYVERFRAAYPDGLTAANLVDALAAYTRGLVTPNARFDRYLRGERSVLTEQEQHGYALFKAVGCVACHQGVNVGGNLFQKFGVFRDTQAGAREEGADPGRYLVTGRQQDFGVFRVPSLRNVALTAPYFHDGRSATLPDAVRTMARVQLDRELSDEDVNAIVAFLGTLTGVFEASPGAYTPGPQQGGPRGR